MTEQRPSTRSPTEILHRLKIVTKLLQDDTLSDEAKARLEQCRCDCKWFLGHHDKY